MMEKYENIDRFLQNIDSLLGFIASIPWWGWILIALIVLIGPGTLLVAIFGGIDYILDKLTGNDPAEARRRVEKRAEQQEREEKYRYIPFMAPFVALVTFFGLTLCLIFLCNVLPEQLDHPVTLLILSVLWLSALVPMFNLLNLFCKRCFNISFYRH